MGKFRFAIFIALALHLPFALAEVENRFGIDVGAGEKSRLGTVGAGFKVYLADWLNFRATGALNKVSDVLTYGFDARLYSTDSDKCAAFFKCRQNLYVFFSGFQSLSDTTNVNKDQRQATYDLSSGSGIMSGIGLRSVYPSGFSTDLEGGWRHWTSAPTATYKSGSQDPDLLDTLQSHWKNDIGGSLTLGWEF